EPVGGARDREDDEGGGVVLADDEPGEDGHEREPQEADDVRDGPDAFVGGGARRLVPGVHEDQRTQAGAAPAAGRARRDRAVTCPYAHRMRFGMFIPQGWRFDLVGIEDARQWPLMRDLARRAEAGPWESVWVYDHFHTTPVPSEEATHEAWSLRAARAASTERVRLGQMCTCMAYRPPMYLAKTAATIDHVSGGRLEMGIGAGWYEHEWRAYGYGFPRAGERLAMLREGVQIMRQAWREGRATFHGDHYEVDGAICRPLPLQEGGVPLWIAGGGEKVTLRIAAEYADYTNFDGTREGFARKSAILADHCREVGTDFERITRTSNYNIAIGRDEAEVADRL